MLRAPRIAVVVDASTDAWMYSARLALAQCTRAWGGAGFVVVPHRAGELSAGIVRAVSAYDPDYVAVSAQTIGQREVVAPGALEIQGADGVLLRGEERAAAISRVSDQVPHDEAGTAACELLIRACTTHRFQLSESGAWDDAIATLTDAGPKGIGLTATDLLPGYVERPCRGASRDWGGALGLLAATMLGSLESPLAGSTDQPTGDIGVALSSWLQGLASYAPPEAIGLAHNPAGADLGFDVGQLPPAWHNSTWGLIPVSHRSTRLTPAYVVLGDSADDFALWMILDRLYGSAVWLHSDWFDAGAGSVQELDRVIHDWQRFKRGVHVCSATMQGEELSRLRDALAARPAAFGASADRHRDRISAGPVSWTPTGMLTLAAHDTFSVELPVPVHRDEEGGVTLLTKPPAMSLFEDHVSPGVEDISWQVELTFESSTMPRGRGLAGTRLCAPDQDRFHTWIRSSRGGITWHSARYDLVLQGSPPDQRVARPKVRELGLDDWTAAMASQHGYRVQVSTAGLRARVLSGLWGSREAMITDFSSPWRDVFDRFGPPGAPGNKGTSARFEEGQGAVISGHGAVLTFDGIRATWPQDTNLRALRERVDELVSRRVLRRGLALICSECNRAAFFALEDLGQENVCNRCSAVTPLSLAAWKTPAEEPLWFYDLHPVARELMQGHGDMPLIAVGHLASGASYVVDTPELELIGKSGPVAETDLLIHADGKVVTGEVKTSDELEGSRKGRRTAASKRVLWADVVRADEVVLATTQPAWGQSSIECMIEALRNHNWIPGHAPRLRTLTDLGSALPTTTYVDW